MDITVVTEAIERDPHGNANDPGLLELGHDLVGVIGSDRLDRFQIVDQEFIRSLRLPRPSSISSRISIASTTDIRNQSGLNRFA